MKKIFLTLTLFFTSSICLAQIPEWMIIDMQNLIMYESIKDLFNYNLSNQEIVEISLGDYGTIWWTTQNYKIKYLPNNLVMYSKKDLSNPLYFFPNDYYSFTYYSRIYKVNTGCDNKKNSWIKYNDPSSYAFAIWTKDEKKKNRYLETYPLNNYSIPLSIEKEIKFDEDLSSVFVNNPELYLELCGDNTLKGLSGVTIDNQEKINYKNLLKSQSNCEKIFDVLKDANGNIWIATGKRLIRFSGKKFFEINIPAFVLEHDSKNNLWIGTTAYNSVGSLVKFDGRNFTFYNSLNSPLPENDGILELKTDQRGNLWIALKRTGLPGKLDNIKIAVYNPEGLQFELTGCQVNVTTIRDYTINSSFNLLYDRLHFQFLANKLDSGGLVEFFLEDNLINSIETKKDQRGNVEINFDYYSFELKKLPLKVFLINLNAEKIELASLYLDQRLNFEGYYLAQNEPNPFSNFTKIEYGCFECRDVELTIKDIFNRKVMSNSNSIVYMHGPTFILENTRLANGVYYYDLSSALIYPFKGDRELLDTKKMILFNPEKIITLPH